MSGQAEWFFFDRAELGRLAAEHADGYRAADPYPSVVLDDFLPAWAAERAAAAFPSPAFEGFKQPDNVFQQRKLGRTQETYFEGLDPFLRHLLNEFNSLAFIDFLEALTGIPGLIPDPHFKGGALHQILPGGRLSIHADFNVDWRRKLARRVNVLLYLNRRWDERYGGHLELWDRAMTRCVRKIAPVLNRCVVFDTMSDTFHGHPDPLACPEGVTRKSIAAYYYTVGRDDGVMQAHNTRWRARPGVDEPRGDDEPAECPSPPAAPPERGEEPIRSRLSRWAGRVRGRPRRDGGRA